MIIWTYAVTVENRVYFSSETREGAETPDAIFVRRSISQTEVFRFFQCNFPVTGADEYETQPVPV